MAMMILDLAFALENAHISNFKKQFPTVLTVIAIHSGDQLSWSNTLVIPASLTPKDWTVNGCIVCLITCVLLLAK